MTRAVRGMARAAGAAKKAVAVMEGRIGILATLAKEHGELSALLARAQRTKDHPKGQEQRRELFHEIRREILSHAKAEERALYSRLEDVPQARQLVIQSAEEHAEIEALVEELSMVDTADEEWVEVCHELAARVHHHVREEEHELFALADAVFQTTELEQMDEEFKGAKAALRDRFDEDAE